MIVYKFGGAIAKTRRGIDALARITQVAYRSEVARSRRRKDSGEPAGLVIVVSAIGHTTRLLARAAELAEDGKLIDAESQLQKIVALHQQLATSLGLDEEILTGAFEAIVSNVSALMEGVAITRELSTRTRDSVLAHGEAFALALFEHVLRDRELRVHTVDARDVIITDETFGHAAPDMGVIAERVKRQLLPRLRRGDIVLIQGFVGATPDGVTTTMGSESSDLTATLLASALDAREVVIWKMLPGIYSADPELVPKARLVRTLSFDEAEEVGRRGARVLYPTFAHPLLGSGSKTILRIAAPFSRSARHTVLSRTISNAAKPQRPLTITIEDKLVALTLTRRAGSPRLRRFGADHALASSLLSWGTSDETSHVIARDDRRSFVRSVDRDHDSIKDTASLAMLSIVFRKLKTEAIDSEIMAQVSRSLRGYAVHAMLPVEQSLIVLVHDADGRAALKKLHHDLFEA